jgi:hypothetical protein
MFFLIRSIVRYFQRRKNPQNPQNPQDPQGAQGW